MIESYYRYSPAETIGIIASPECNVVFDSTGKLAFTGAVQGVNVWNLRQASMTKTLNYEDFNYPYSDFGEVKCLLRLPDKTSICVGYSSGEVRIFNYVQGSLTTTLRGHRSAVISLAIDEQSGGSLLATGGADCDIIIWDLVSLTGIARFHEHKDAVTGLAFLSREDNQKLLLSVSKDTLLKVWDLETRHCIQTIVGHRSEIWSIAVVPSPSDVKKIRVFTGSSDELIRVYKVNSKTSNNEETTTPATATAPPSSSSKQMISSTVAVHDEEVLTLFGSLERSAGVDRCVSLSLNASRSLLAAQSAGKFIDIYRLRDIAEAKKKMKRRIKRSQAKTSHKAAEEDEDKESDNEENNNNLSSQQQQQEILIVDEIELLTTMKQTTKVTSFVFNPVPFNATDDLALIAYVNNSLEIYKIPHSIDQGLPLKLSLIDLSGHRSDIRGIAISHDGNSLGTCSSESVKLWTTRGFQCTGTCYSEGSYCLSVSFAPGGRHLLCGCKDGKLKIFDFASGDCIFSIDDAHENAAIWSIAVRPDGKGFMTGSADKTVKFWLFNLTGEKLTAELDRQLVLPADVLCVRYNASKSANQLLVAVGLLDNTIRIFYEDSLKLFLTLYGHKLPVMCLDMSSDHMLLASGSADKTIKIWGLDFGDCHRSLFGHSDSITCIRFIPHTHYFFSGSKDSTIRYWDGDKFEQILLLTGHKGSIWGLEVPLNGKYLYSCGADRSIRVWQRSEELVFLQEEREKMMEAQVDKSAQQDANQKIRGVDGGETALIPGTVTMATEVSTNPMIAAMSSIDSIRSGESLMTAIDLVEETLETIKEKYLSSLEKEAGKKGALSDDEKVRLYEKIEKETIKTNPMFLQLTPYPYLQRNLKMIKLPDLEPALLLLPFHYVKRLFPLLTELLRRGYELELNSRIVLFLLMIHTNKIITTKMFLPELLSLQELMFQNLFAYHQLIGMNKMGLWLAQQQIAQRKEEEEMLQEVRKGGEDGFFGGGLITTLTPEMGLNAKEIAHLDGGKTQSTEQFSLQHQQQLKEKRKDPPQRGDAETAAAEKGRKPGVKKAKFV